jgi:plasmid replication initiation protein
MDKLKMSKEITGLQNNTDYVVMDNVFANPKFIRGITKDKKPNTVNEVYTPKLFIEIVSRLKPENLEYLENNQYLTIELNIKDFLNSIEVGEKHGYTYIFDVLDKLQGTQIKWDNDSSKGGVVLLPKYNHIKGSGKIDLFIDGELAKKLLAVKNVENFSFLKENFFRLKTSPAIKLYQFFKSWLNKGEYITYKEGEKTGLEIFKGKFGYNTSGYKDFSTFELKVLKPATAEINEKTDIVVNYEPIGENLKGLRPRVNGLKFTITAKKGLKQLPTGERHQPQQPQDEKTHISNLITQTIPQEQKPTPPKPQATTDEPSQTVIMDLAQKLDITAEQVQELKSKLKGDNIRLYEVLKGCLNEIKKGANIKSNIAYIKGSLSDLGLGAYKTEKETETKQAQARAEKEKKQFLETIQNEYKKARDNEFIKIYNEAEEFEKKAVFEEIRDNPKNIGSIGNFHLDSKDNTKLNNFGTIHAGEILGNLKGITKQTIQAKFRENIYTKTQKTIDFDSQDQVILL